MREKLIEEGKAGDLGVSKPGEVTVEMVDVTYGILTPNKKLKRLLKNVNLTLKSGTMVALMGPSGAGKSTLLDFLADRKMNGIWAGEILVDGRPRPDSFQLRTAYVLQDDVHIATLTVEEILYFSAWTRVPSAKTKEDRWARVDQLLEMMGLQHVRKSIVGDALHKGISGGQMKRLSIAVELVSLPDVIFLDEPTSGLDSSISLEVMSAVKKITGGNRLCVSTIHQPSPEVFALFDRLVLMCAGRMVFCGEPHDCVAHFTSPALGYRFARGSNPAEFVVAVGGGTQAPENGTPRTAEELESLFKASRYFTPMPLGYKERMSEAAFSHTRSANAGGGSSVGTEDFALTTSFLTQLHMLMTRTWRAKIRDVADVRAQLMKNIVVGLLIGIVFNKQGSASSPLYQYGIPNAEVSNVSSLLFFSLMYTMVGNLQAIPYLSSQNIVYRRELAAHAYKTLPYWLTQLVTTLPLLVVNHTLFVLLSFFLVDFPRTGEYFFYYYLSLLSANVVSFYSALWLAASTGNEQVAFALFPLMFLFTANFAGFAITINAVPPFWCWAPYISYARWLYEGLMVNEWTRFDTDDFAIPALQNGNGNVLSVYDFENFDKWNSYWIAVLYMMGFAAMTYYAMLPARKKIIKFTAEEELAARSTIAPHITPNSPTVAGTAAYDPRRSSFSPAGHGGTSTLDERMTFSLRQSLATSNPVALVPRNSSISAVGEILRESIVGGFVSQNSITAFNTTTSTQAPHHQRHPRQKSHTAAHNNHTSANAYQASKYGAKGHVSGGVASTSLAGTRARSRDVLQSRRSHLGGGGGLDDEDDLDEEEKMKRSLRPSVTVDFYRQSTGLIDRAEGCHLKFTDVTYSVPHPTNKHDHLQLLRGITGQVRPGEMCALMGASGAGKSTLLDVLAQRKNTGTIAGDITYNGLHYPKSTAYVMQDNVHLGLLSVRQNLYFAAQLRLPEHWDVEKKEKRVQKILEMLGLQEVANSVVGTATIRGISGGQLKRLSIAVEIVHLPSVIFLDEPTTGLDSAIAFEVMAAVRNLANQQRTALCTIHAPSQATFDLFDTLLLLAKGRVIYYGAVREAVSYFLHSPFAFPYQEGSNVADYVVAVGGGFILSPTKQQQSSDGHVSGEELADYFAALQQQKLITNPGDALTNSGKQMIFSAGVEPPSSPLHATTTTSTKTKEEEETEALTLLKYNTSTWHQIKTLTHRLLLKTSRDRRATVVASVRHIIVGLFYGSLYFQLATGTEPADYTNRLGLFFFTIMFLTIGHQQSIPAILDDRLVFYRERGAKAYGAFSYWLSLLTVQVPLVLFNTFLYTVIVYFMVGLRNKSSSLGYYYYFIAATSTTGYFIANLMAAVSPSTQAALSYYPIVLFVAVSFAGFLVYIPRFPDWLGAWAPYISFMRYSFQGLTLNEFDGNSQLPDGSIYISELGFGSLSISTCAGVLFFWLTFYALMFLLALRFINFEQR